METITMREVVTFRSAATSLLKFVSNVARAGLPTFIWIMSKLKVTDEVVAFVRRFEKSLLSKQVRTCDDPARPPPRPVAQVVLPPPRPFPPCPEACPPALPVV
jgi:hypothetical protein